MNKKGQLFLIEVIIALTVLVILISALFSIQSYSPPADQSSLTQNGEQAIQVLVSTGLMYTYLEMANYSYYTLKQTALDTLNATKLDVKHTIEGNIPSIANFKAITQRYNDTSKSWEQVDTVNFDASLPTGSNVPVIEYYTSGFHGNFVQFKFSLYLWYEVSG